MLDAGNSSCSMTNAGVFGNADAEPLPEDTKRTIQKTAGFLIMTQSIFALLMCCLPAKICVRLWVEDLNERPNSFLSLNEDLGAKGVKLTYASALTRWIGALFPIFSKRTVLSMFLYQIWHALLPFLEPSMLFWNWQLMTRGGQETGKPKEDDELHKYIGVDGAVAVSFAYLCRNYSFWVFIVSALVLDPDEALTGQFSIWNDSVWNLQEGKLKETYRLWFPVLVLLAWTFLAFMLHAYTAREYENYVHLREYHLRKRMDPIHKDIKRCTNPTCKEKMEWEDTSCPKCGHMFEIQIEDEKEHISRLKGMNRDRNGDRAKLEQELSITGRTVIVFDIPNDIKTHEQLREYFEDAFCGHCIEKARLCPDTKKLRTEMTRARKKRPEGGIVRRLVLFLFGWCALISSLSYLILSTCGHWQRFLKLYKRHTWQICLIVLAVCLMASVAYVVRSQLSDWWIAKAREFVTEEFAKSCSSLVREGKSLSSEPGGIGPTATWRGTLQRSRSSKDRHHLWRSSTSRMGFVTFALTASQEEAVRSKLLRRRMSSPMAEQQWQHVEVLAAPPPSALIWHNLPRRTMFQDASSMLTRTFEAVSLTVVLLFAASTLAVCQSWVMRQIHPILCYLVKTTQPHCVKDKTVSECIQMDAGSLLPDAVAAGLVFQIVLLLVEFLIEWFAWHGVSWSTKDYNHQVFIFFYHFQAFALYITFCFPQDGFAALLEKVDEPIEFLVKLVEPLANNITACGRFYVYWFLVRTGCSNFFKFTRVGPFVIQTWCHSSSWLSWDSTDEGEMRRKEIRHVWNSFRQQASTCSKCCRLQAIGALYKKLTGQTTRAKTTTSGAEPLLRENSQQGVPMDTFTSVKTSVPIDVDDAAQVGRSPNRSKDDVKCQYFSEFLENPYWEDLLPDMLMGMHLIMGYAVINSAVVVAGMFYFWVNAICMRFQFLLVYIQKDDGGGEFFESLVGMTYFGFSVSVAMLTLKLKNDEETFSSTHRDSKTGFPEEMAELNRRLTRVCIPLLFAIVGIMWQQRWRLSRLYQIPCNQLPHEMIHRLKKAETDRLKAETDRLKAAPDGIRTEPEPSPTQEPQRFVSTTSVVTAAVPLLPGEEESQEGCICRGEKGYEFEDPIVEEARRIHADVVRLPMSLINELAKKGVCMTKPPMNLPYSEYQIYQADYEELEQTAAAKYTPVSACAPQSRAGVESVNGLDFLAYPTETSEAEESALETAREVARVEGEAAMPTLEPPAQDQKEAISPQTSSQCLSHSRRPSGGGDEGGGPEAISSTSCTAVDTAAIVEAASCTNGTAAATDDRSALSSSSSIVQEVKRENESEQYRFDVQLPLRAVSHRVRNDDTSDDGSDDDTSKEITRTFSVPQDKNDFARVRLGRTEAYFQRKLDKLLASVRKLNNRRLESFKEMGYFWHEKKKEHEQRARKRFMLSWVFSHRENQRFGIPPRSFNKHVLDEWEKLDEKEKDDYRSKSEASADDFHLRTSQHREKTIKQLVKRRKQMWREENKAFEKDRSEILRKHWQQWLQLPRSGKKARDKAFVVYGRKQLGGRWSFDHVPMFELYQQLRGLPVLDRKYFMQSLVHVEPAEWCKGGIHRCKTAHGPCIVMEDWEDHISLLEVINSWFNPSNEARFELTQSPDHWRRCHEILRKLKKSVDILHSLGWVHCNLKAEDVLVKVAKADKSDPHYLKSFKLWNFLSAVRFQATLCPVGHQIHEFLTEKTQTTCAQCGTDYQTTIAYSCSSDKCNHAYIRLCSKCISSEYLSKADHVMPKTHRAPWMLDGDVSKNRDYHGIGLIAVHLLTGRWGHDPSIHENAAEFLEAVATGVTCLAGHPLQKLESDCRNICRNQGCKQSFAEGYYCHKCEYYVCNTCQAKAKEDQASTTSTCVMSQQKLIKAKRAKRIQDQMQQICKDVRELLCASQGEDREQLLEQLLNSLALSGERLESLSRINRRQSSADLLNQAENDRCWKIVSSHLDPDIEDIFTGVMTIPEAKRKCLELAGCKGFTFQGPLPEDRKDKVEVTISFKDAFSVHKSSVRDYWISYQLLPEVDYPILKLPSYELPLEESFKTTPKRFRRASQYYGMPCIYRYQVDCGSELNERTLGALRHFEPNLRVILLQPKSARFRRQATLVQNDKDTLAWRNIIFYTIKLFRTSPEGRAEKREWLETLEKKHNDVQSSSWVKWYDILEDHARSRPEVLCEFDEFDFPPQCWDQRIDLKRLNFRSNFKIQLAFIARREDRTPTSKEKGRRGDLCQARRSGELYQARGVNKCRRCGEFTELPETSIDTSTECRRGGCTGTVYATQEFWHYGIVPIEEDTVVREGDRGLVCRAFDYDGKNTMKWVATLTDEILFPLFDMTHFRRRIQDSSHWKGVFDEMWFPWRNRREEE